MELYKKGSRGAMVRRIQQAVGCYPDGIFGSLTEEAVKTWQREHGLTADGIAGPRTLAAMGISAVQEGFKGSSGSSDVSQITACYGGKTLTLRRSKRRIDEIIVHCTASREGQEQTVEQIRRDHTTPVSKGGRGWSDIGYQYVVYLDGTVHEGRDVDISGAHVSGHNAHSIGVVYVGGLDKDGKPKDTRTEAQKAALLLLLMDLRKLYPKARIRGHRDFSRDLNGNGIIEPREWVKACPCFDAAKEYRMV